MEEALLALLSADAGVLSHVPSSSMAWSEIGQDIGAPYLVLTLISGVDDLHMNGPNALPEYRVQIDTYAETNIAAVTAGRAVFNLLHGYRSGPFRLIQHAGTRSLPRDSGANQAERLFRTSQDFTVHWRLT